MKNFIFLINRVIPFFPKSITLVLFIHFFAGDFASAQSSLSPELEPIVVTATRAPEALSASIQSVEVITEQEIKNTSAHELDDVLRFEPGIDIPGYSGESQHPTSNSLSMRGLGGSGSNISRGLVLLDGIPINDPYFGYIQWGRIPLDNIDHVEIVQGGGSPLWGNFAEGGVINVITKKPNGDSGSVNVGYGNYGTYSASVSKSFSAQGDSAFQIFAQSNGTNGYQQVPNYERIAANVPTSYHTDNIKLKQILSLTNDLSINLTFDYHQNHQQLETNIDSNNQQYNTFSGDMQYRFSDKSNLTWSAFNTNSNYTTNNGAYACSVAWACGDPTTLLNTSDYLWETHNAGSRDYGSSLIWNKSLDGLVSNFKLGADYRRVGVQDNVLYSPNAVLNGGLSSSTASASGNQSFLGLFGQLELKPSKDLSLQGSGRFQSIKNTNGYDGSSAGVGATQDTSYSSFLPRLDARYNISENSIVRAAAYQSFRAPTIADMYYFYFAGVYGFEAAPNLKPEKLDGAEIGYDFSQRNIKSYTTLYEAQISDYIMSAPALDGSGNYQNQNIAKVKANGIQERISIEIIKNLQLKAGATYALSTIVNNPSSPSSIGQQVVDVPRYKLMLGVDYKFAPNWKFAAQAQKVAASMYACADHTNACTGGYPYAISADPYTVIDTSVAYTLSTRTELYLKIHNLLNASYIATAASGPSAQILASPLTAFAGLKYNFN